MTQALSPSEQHLVQSLERDGFAFAQADTMRRLFSASALAAWEEFADSWNDLGVDRYMADGGRYRRRHHATLCVTQGSILREPHQPHYQSRDYNALNGGIERWFEPMAESVTNSPVLHTVLGQCRRVFSQLSPDIPAWHVELHQFRIEARPDEAGKPTPEGMHRDGVDWVLVLLIRRENIAQGVTRIADIHGNDLGTFALGTPLDAAWIDDHRVYHGVTPIEPIDPAKPAFRDVLVVTFRRRYSAGAD